MIHSPSLVPLLSTSSLRKREREQEKNSIFNGLLFFGMFFLSLFLLQPHRLWLPAASVFSFSAGFIARQTFSGNASSLEWKRRCRTFIYMRLRVAKKYGWEICLLLRLDDPYELEIERDRCSSLKEKENGRRSMNDGGTRASCGPKLLRIPRVDGASDFCVSCDTMRACPTLA